jgi:hypothetical protein
MKRVWHMRPLLIHAGLVLLAFGLIDVPAARAGDADDDPMGLHSGIDGYFQHWFDRVNAAQASQPSWMPPLVTTTPLLLELVRYDQFWEHAGNGANVNVFDGNHFMELIPTTTNEILINPPAYQQRSGGMPASGWGDWPFLGFKQRLLSANAQEGNYILTSLLTVQVPSGNKAFTNLGAIITPSIAGGKGWGNFVVQAAFAVPIPTSHESTIGYAPTLNVALQYHLLQYLWPEVEINTTDYLTGARAGKVQTFITPGVMFGIYPIAGRIRTIVGAGYQVAVTPKLTRSPVLTPVYDHAWILSVRMLF